MRKQKEGIVISSNMEKTAVVLIESIVKHPLYKKYIKRRKKYIVHNEKDAKIGDKVKIIETRPISKMKRWAVIEVLK